MKLAVRSVLAKRESGAVAQRKVSRRAPWSGYIYAGVLAVVFWAPFAFGSVEPWAVGILKVAAFVLLAVWALGGAIAARFVVNPNPAQITLFGAALLGVVQSLPIGETLSVDPFATRQVTMTLLAFGVLFSLMLVTFDNAERLRKAALLAFAVALVLSVFGVVQRLSGTADIYWFREIPYEGVLPFGPYVNKNHFAGLIELWFPLGMGFVVTGLAVRQTRFVLLVAGGAVCGAVFMSGSRTGTAIVFLQLCTLFFLYVASLRGEGIDIGQFFMRLLVSAAVVVAILYATSMMIDPWEILDSFQQLFEPDSRARDELSRWEMWRDTWPMFLANPIFGVGLGAFATAFTGYTSGTGRTMVVNQAHNDYLQFLAEGGLIGALLGLLFLVVLARAAWRGTADPDPSIRSVAIGGTIGCLGLLLHSLVDFNLQIPSNALAFLFTAALVVRTVNSGRSGNARVDQGVR
jgi:O-antigen ligase